MSSDPVEMLGINVRVTREVPTGTAGDLPLEDADAAVSGAGKVSLPSTLRFFRSGLLAAEAVGRWLVVD